MTDSPDSVNDSHMELIKSITNRVESIYRQLCEFEEMILSQKMDDIGDTDSNIMDLLDTIDTIQEAAEMIRPSTCNVENCHNELESQILCLEKAMELMELERKME